MPPTIPFLASNLSGVIQDGLLEQKFHDSLTPILLWRQLFERRRHEGRIGEIVNMTRPGLIVPGDENTAAIVAGQDPQTVTRAVERFSSQPASKGQSLLIDLPSSYEAQANFFLDDCGKMIFAASQTMSRIARNKTMAAYGGGNTFATALGNSATTVQVKDITGFDTVLDGNGIPQVVSNSYPLPCTIAGAAVSVIGFSPSTPNVGNTGPGTLTLAAAATWSKWDAVVRGDAPVVFRANSRTSDHLIVSGDVAAMEVFRRARAYLRSQNVPTLDGTRNGPYGVFIPPSVDSALRADPEYHDAIKGQGLTGPFVDGMIGQFGGIRFIENTEMLTFQPDSDYQTSIQRCFMFGAETGVETYIPEADFAGEAQPEGIATANHYKTPVDPDGVMSFILRAPLDNLGRRLTASWVANADYTLPTDALAQNGAARLRRGAVIHIAG